ERLARLRAAYRAKRDAFERLLRVHFRDLAEWRTPSGGLFFWLRLRQARSLSELLPAALARGVAFVPGESFFPGSAESGTLRLNFSNASEQEMAEGLARLAA